MTDVRQLRIEIGAAINASLNSAIRNVQQMQKQLAKDAKEAAREQKRASDDAKQALKKNIQEQQAALKTLDSWQKKALKDRTAQEKLAAKEATDAAKKKAQEIKRLEEDVNRTVKRQLAERRAAEREAMREVERDLREHNRRMKEDAGGGGGGGNRSHLGFGSRFGSTMALRAASGAMHLPGRLAGSVLGGLGVNYSIEGQVAGFVERQRLASLVSNQAYNPGIKGMTDRVDPSTILKEATNVAIGTGTDTEEILQGMSKFVSHTGDLKTMRDTMADLAKISKANGANFVDMATAVAEVSNEMGDVENKGEAINSVLRALGGQGQMNAIELKDQARNLAKIAGQAGFFKIDPLSAKTLEGQGVTNDIGQKIAVVSALAQKARGRGGRSTAKQAMQSAQSFIADMTSPNQLKQWNKAGIPVYTDAGHTMARDPLQILLESFRRGRAKGGINQDVLKNLFPKANSRAVAAGFAQDYNEAYEKAAREGVTKELDRHRIAAEAVTEKFQEILRATQSMKQVDDSFSVAMKSADSQVKIFNAHMNKAADELLIKLIPALTKLAPLFIKLADTLVDKLGLKTDEASKDAHSAEIDALNAQSVVNQLTEVDPKTGHMRGGQISDKTQANILAAKKNLEQRISDTDADIKRRGKDRYGLFAGKNYEDMSDEEIRAQAEKTLFGHDEKGEAYIQSKEQLKTLTDSLNQLNVSLNKLEFAKSTGQVTTPTPVSIVEDKTTPPASVMPKEGGVSGVDATE